jgi:hypothetical protein
MAPKTQVIFSFVRIFAVVAAPTIGSALFLSDKHAEFLITMLATFLAFLLAQSGLMVYERSKEQQELTSLVMSARNELVMNKNTVGRIYYLVDKKLAERHIHGHGFRGVDEISSRAIANLIASPLTHKYLSRDFSSDQLLRKYQTTKQLSREIPTEDLDVEMMAIAEPSYF